MPAHGRATFMAEAVESVIAQTHCDWRLHIVDDGEPGGEIERAVGEHLDDERVSYTATGKPMSANQAQTAVMGVGDAPYFAFLHDDDRWGPRFLERRVAFMEAHPRCGFVFSGHIDVDEQGRPSGRTPLRFEPGELERSELLPRFYFTNAVPTMHSAMVRRSALEEVGVRVDPGFPRLYDWELWLRLAARFAVGFIAGEDDVHYRVHTHQMSKRPGLGRDFLEMFERVDQVLAAQAPELRLDSRARDRERSRIQLSIGLDRLAAADRRGALAALGEARRARPAALLHYRALALLGGIALGPVGRRVVGRVRLAAYRHGLPGRAR
jgi:glycosyltransferase involved in cell wall biosynthesis